MKTYRKPILFAALGLVFISFVVFRITQSSSSENPARQLLPLVKTIKPVRETITKTLTYNGDVLAYRQANIFAKVTGTLEAVYADIGDYTKEGQLLAVIDSTELAQQVLLTSATYENAMLNYDRARKLAEQNLIATQDFDNATAAMTVAKANYESAKTRLSYSRITAPFSGIITRRFLDPGAVITTSNPTLFTLMDLDRVKVVVSVPERDVPFVQKVKTASITVDALPGATFRGTLSRLSQALDMATRTMLIQIDVENRDHTIKPGMFATVTLFVDQHKNALLLPLQSVLADEKGRFIFALSTNKVKKIYVKSGWEVNNRLEILDGLAEGEDVVESGQQQLRDGSEVKVIE
jgi:membrane fusion protein (multidrug efflux system)